MIQRYKRLAVALGAVVLLAGGVLATSALAETPTPEPGATATQPTPRSQRYREVFLAKLATILGVDQPKLEASMKQASKDTVDEAVRNGNLTPAQADQARQRIDQGGQGFFGHFGRGGPRGDARVFKGLAGVKGQETLEAVADKLGMSVQDLQAELRSGKSLSDVAKDKGVSEQDLRDAATAAAKAQLDQAMKDGKLTQEQADAILGRMQQGQWPWFGFHRGKFRG